MSFRFTLECRDEGSFSTIYSFRKEGEDRTELEKFWDKAEVQDAPDCDNLRLRLYEDILHEWNFTHPNCFHGDQRWFRAEGDATDPEGMSAEAICASIPAEDLKHLPKPYPRLRLFCFRMKQILVVGNGGVKREQRIRDNPDLLAAWGEIRHVMCQVHERVTWHDSLEIVENGYLFDGDVHFDKPDLP